MSKSFFDMWHKKWLETSRLESYIDMPALNFTLKNFYGDDVPLLPDAYNCQISRSWRDFLNAKIIHFFTGWQENPFEQPYIFQKESFWQKVKENGIDESVWTIIRDPLTAFDDNFGLYGKVENEFRQTALYGFIADVFVNRNNKKTFFILEKCIRLLSKLFH